ncbi:MAG: restriction endonuclease, partial [Thermodesulfobacteriota bacterium]
MQHTKLILIIIYLILLASSVAFAARIYKWVDEDGVVHVTDNPETIPEKHRHGIEEPGTESKIDKLLAKLKEVWKKSDSQKNLIGIVIAGFVFILICHKILIYTKLKFQERKRAKRDRALQLSGIDKMNPEEFRNYVCNLLDRQGFKVEIPDGAFNLGVDFIAQKKNAKYAVQLKKQQSTVSSLAISDIEREKHRYDCKTTMVITDNYFAEDAIRLAGSKECELIDRDAIADWVK